MLNLRVVLLDLFNFGSLASITLAYHHREQARKYCELTYQISQREIGVRDIYLKEDFARITSYMMSSL